LINVRAGGPEILVPGILRQGRRIDGLKTSSLGVIDRMPRALMSNERNL
jgi:hypothetical protein